MTRHLFIGGPADGEWREVDADSPWWRVVEWPQEVRATPYGPSGVDLQTGTVHMYLRRLYKDFDAGRTHAFYVHPDVKSNEVFSMLVAAYPRSK